eukprot:CAMPEP_0185255676 /NCGR_PEP_ID=MMETSP1359-20130426/4758_1 /TAXON_ID=552665 /ORGANISM="Bigelowiella longifila, Strain CCMP242" /LENGTH=93 /DNA_ID=CAMNT_0027839793 /DNA_START=164 /DNA_END=442 /DNA_ORIENTATION=-
MPLSRSAASAIVSRFLQIAMRIPFPAAEDSRSQAKLDNGSTITPTSLTSFSTTSNSSRSPVPAQRKWPPSAGKGSSPAAEQARLITNEKKKKK